MLSHQKYGGIILNFIAAYGLGSCYLNSFSCRLLKEVVSGRAQTSSQEPPKKMLLEIIDRGFIEED